MEVETVTIDGVVESEGPKRLDFINLDIEGAELMALKGAAQSITRFKPIICLELPRSEDMNLATRRYLIELG